MARRLCVFLFMSIFKLSQCQVELTGSDIAFEGEEYVLTCHIAANEGTRYFWYKNGDTIARSGSDSLADGSFCGVINKDGFQSDRYEVNCKQHQLIIKSIDSSDDGVTWRCHNSRYSTKQFPEYGGTFTMKTGIPVTDINMSVTSSNTYRHTNNALQIHRGSTLLIDCQPNDDASPAPTIRLYISKHGPVLLLNTTGHHLKTSLTVTMERDGSTLYCEANNSKQIEGSRYTTLQVLDPHNNTKRDISVFIGVGGAAVVVIIIAVIIIVVVVKKRQCKQTEMEIMENDLYISGDTPTSQINKILKARGVPEDSTVPEMGDLYASADDGQSKHDPTKLATSSSKDCSPKPEMEIMENHLYISADDNASQNQTDGNGVKTKPEMEIMENHLYISADDNASQNQTDGNGVTTKPEMEIMENHLYVSADDDASRNQTDGNGVKTKPEMEILENLLYISADDDASHNSTE